MILTKGPRKQLDEIVRFATITTPKHPMSSAFELWLIAMIKVGTKTHCVVPCISLKDESQSVERENSTILTKANAASRMWAYEVITYGVQDPQYAGTTE